MNILRFIENSTLGWLVLSNEHFEEGCLSSARVSPDGDKLFWRNLERHAIKRNGLIFSVVFGNVLKVKHMQVLWYHGSAQEKRRAAYFVVCLRWAISWRISGSS